MIRKMEKKKSWFWLIVLFIIISIGIMLWSVIYHYSILPHMPVSERLEKLREIERLEIKYAQINNEICEDLISKLRFLDNVIDAWTKQKNNYDELKDINKDIYKYFEEDHTLRDSIRNAKSRRLLILDEISKNNCSVDY
jgi:t-SNARE complex subunit (syntaxin)